MTSPLLIQLAVDSKLEIPAFLDPSEAFCILGHSIFPESLLFGLWRAPLSQLFCFTDCCISCVGGGSASDEEGAPAPSPCTPSLSALADLIWSLLQINLFADVDQNYFSSLRFSFSSGLLCLAANLMSPLQNLTGISHFTSQKTNSWIPTPHLNSSIHCLLSVNKWIVHFPRFLDQAYLISLLFSHYTLSLLENSSNSGREMWNISMMSSTSHLVSSVFISSINFISSTCLIFCLDYFNQFLCFYLFSIPVHSPRHSWNDPFNSTY